jgi:predicted O-methyltransferase YrrM
MQYRNYVEQIDAFADATFDIVLVDGAARPSCIMHSIHKVKPGGLLIVDNTTTYNIFQQIMPLLQDFDRTVYYGAYPTNYALDSATVYHRR